MDLAAPKGIYRVNTLARLNVCEQINTPLAQAELEEFRERFGRPAQSTMLYHWARLIELVYACERVIEILEDPEITDTHVRNEVTPGAGRGVGCVEAPRGTLIHDYVTDAERPHQPGQHHRRHHPQRGPHEHEHPAGGGVRHPERRGHRGGPEQGGNGGAGLRPVTELRHSPPGWRSHR